MRISKPDIQVDIFFVEHGYQADIKDNQSSKDDPDAGCLVSTFCRDFGDSYEIKWLKSEMISHVCKMLDEFRKNK